MYILRIARGKLRTAVLLLFKHSTDSREVENEIDEPLPF